MDCMDPKDSAEALRQAIERYNAAWNAHDLDAIMAMHAPDMVFENHTAGEAAEGEAARAHIGSIFETWPDIEFTTRRLYARGMDGGRHPRQDDAPRRPRRRADRRPRRVGRP